MMPDLGNAAAPADDRGSDDDDTFMPSLPAVMAAPDDEAGAAVDLGVEPSLTAHETDDAALTADDTYDAVLTADDTYDAALTADETDDAAPPAHEDFIAAARRAAQSATPRSGLSSVSGFSLFSRKKPATTKEQPAAMLWRPPGRSPSRACRWPS